MEIIICLDGKTSSSKEMSVHAGEKQFSYEEMQLGSGVKLPPNLAERFETEEMTAQIDGKTSRGKEMTAHICEKQFGCR